MRHINRFFFSHVTLVAAVLLMMNGAQAATTCELVKQQYAFSIAQCGPGIPVPPPDVMGVNARGTYEFCKEILKGIDQILLQACPDNAHLRSRKRKGQETELDPRRQAAPAGTSSNKNNLDKFDLGPNFVSPSTVSPGTRGAQSSGSGGSPKATITVAPGDSGGAKTYSPGVQSQPPQQIK